MNVAGSHLSKEFFELIKSIGECRSKQEEDQIITDEVSRLKIGFKDPSLTAPKMREYLVRAIYVEMLGHDASFSYIHAVKFVQDKNLFCKLTGYLACNLCLSKDHELMLLLINTIHKDLNSKNFLEVSAALTCVCHLVNQEMIPAIFPLIKNAASHSSELIRKKVCIALNKLNKTNSGITDELKEYVMRAICDPDPCVIGASLYFLHELAKSNPGTCKDLVAPLVIILKQICEHRLSREYDYHRIPAPWLQIKILSLLGTLGAADQRASEQMYEVLQLVVRRADIGVNAAFAIMSECVKTIATIYPSQSLLELAASSISRFISSGNNNLKYVGVTGLASIVQVNPEYAAPHQLVVVDCLEDPDETLKRKTLDLLYCMTNPQNVKVVVEKFLLHLRNTLDRHMRQDLACKVIQLAERYAPDDNWYLDSINSILEMAGSLLNSDVTYNLVRLVAEGPSGNEIQDMKFRRYAVNTYVKWLDNLQNLPDPLIQVICWVLGEYGNLVSVKGYSVQHILDILCNCIERNFDTDGVRGWIVTAITKLCCINSVENLESIKRIINIYQNSQSTDVQQRCYEIAKLLYHSEIMKDVIPYDSFSEDIDFDDQEFLKEFVNNSLNSGAKPYLSQSERTKSMTSTRPPLYFSLYDTSIKRCHQLKPELTNRPINEEKQNIPLSDDQNNEYHIPRSSEVNFMNSEAQACRFQVQGPRRWGPEGYNRKSTADASSCGKYNAEEQSEAPFFSKGSDYHLGWNKNSSEYRFSHQSEREKMATALFGGITPVIKSYTQNIDDLSKRSMMLTESTKVVPGSEDVFGAELTDSLSKNNMKTKQNISLGSHVHLLDLDNTYVDEKSNDLGGMSKSDESKKNLEFGGIEFSDNEVSLLDLEGLSIDAKSETTYQFEPLNHTIEMVGANWSKAPIEKKFELPNDKCLDCDTYLHNLEALGVGVVQVINQEGIGAVRQQNTNLFIYIHCKILDNIARITLRSNCENSAIEYFLQKIH